MKPGQLDHLSKVNDLIQETERSNSIPVINFPVFSFSLADD
jgi:hypothetical protein